MSVNKQFADIVHNSLYDVDELCDDILLEEEVFQPRMFHDQMPPFIIARIRPLVEYAL